MALAFNLKKQLKGFNIDLGLSIEENITVLFGPSGAGKSLLLYMISGIVTPDEGVISVGKQDVYNSSRRTNLPIRRRGIGHLFQDYALFPHMTVYQNIAYGISHLPKPSIRQKVDELIGLMRLNGLSERRPDEISGGQRQRTALARTLATEPRVLLLDEPFSALDNQVREKLRADLTIIHRKYPITTLFVTHDLEEAFVMGDRIAVINKGKLEQYGPKEEVFFKPKTKNVARLLGTRNIFSGTVTGVNGGLISIRSEGLGEIKVKPDGSSSSPSNGESITFGIRPEEVMVIRPDKPLDKMVEDNIIEGVIDSIVAKGASHTLFFKNYNGKASLKIEIPNFAFRKISPSVGEKVAVSLKRESIWIIPETS